MISYSIRHCAILLSTVAAVAIATPASAQQRQFNLPATDAVDGIANFAQQSGLQIVAPAERLRGRYTPAIIGRLDARVALYRLLQATNLEIARDDGGVIVLRNRLQASLRQNISQVTTMAAAAPAQMAAQSAMSAEAVPAAGSAEDGQELVVTGTRGRPRTVRESPVPIDVIPETEIKATSYVDTNSVLMTLIPSYAVQRNSNSDAGTFVRPATLRGLPADKTLLLVNSKRRHRSAAVSASGNGAQAADAAQIPSSAIKTIEVLRDGAAALYGSDAIAGVINFLLKDDDHGASMSARYGQYYQGDGRDINVDGNFGAKLTDSGFLNVSLEYTRQQRTSRGGQYCTTAFCVPTYAAQNPTYAALIGDPNEPVQRMGQPKSEAIRSFVNAGIDVSDELQLYAFGNLSRSNTHADATYRPPAGGNSVNDVPVRLADGSIFRFSQIYPAGFTFDYSAKLTDASIVGGARGELPLGTGLTYDVSGRWGYDRMQYFANGTVNPSLGPDSPHNFMRAIYVSESKAANADFTYKIDTGFKEPITIAFGGEYQNESFKMKQGEPLAYAVGPYARSNPYGFCTAAHTLSPTAPQNAGINCANYVSSSADGFAGIDPVYNTLATLSLTVSPQTAASTSRNSKAAYIEASSDVTNQLFLDIAGRYEDFSDFGSTANWKASGRFAFIPQMAVRGSIGTGFRAPTPGQQIFSNTSINTTNGQIATTGLFAAGSSVAQFLGAQPLKPEKSFNISAGTTAQFLGINLSVDFYHIKLKDQYYATSLQAVNPAIRAAMIAAGVSGAESISSVQFFQNAFDSTTWGIDVVGTGRHNWGNGHTTQLTSSFNYNKYKVDKINVSTVNFDREAIFDFQNATPRWKEIVTLVHSYKEFDLTLRSTIWGPYRNMFDATANSPVQKFHPEPFLDAEISYRHNEHYTFTAGVRNLFSNYPQRDRIGETTSAGGLYRSDSLVDWQGGFYYARVDFKF
jgi:iron complex outermembrane receptor protein